MKRWKILLMGLVLTCGLTACSESQQSDAVESQNQTEIEDSTGMQTNSDAGNGAEHESNTQNESSAEHESDVKNESSAEHESDVKNESSAEHESDAENENETGTENGPETERDFQSSSQNTSDSRILIAYFSVPEDVDTGGTDAVAGASIVVKDSEKMGNTEYVAGLVQETVGGDLFRIETQEQYPLDHDPLVDQAAEEQDVGARPALAAHIEDLEQYDTVILGYPNWWGDLPQPLYTFLEEYDFSGKTIIPFVTHGGSGFSGTRDTIAQLQPDADVSDNTLSLSRNQVAGSREDVIEWAESLGLQQ